MNWLKRWNIRRQMRRNAECINYLLENIKFAQAEIPAFEEEQRRLQSRLWSLDAPKRLINPACRGAV